MDSDSEYSENEYAYSTDSLISCSWYGCENDDIVNVCENCEADYCKDHCFMIFLFDCGDCRPSEYANFGYYVDGTCKIKCVVLVFVKINMYIKDIVIIVFI